MRCVVVVDFADCRSPTWYFTYQRYFMRALNAVPGVRVSVAPADARLLSPLYEAKVRGAHRLWNSLAEFRRRSAALRSDSSPRWTFRFENKTSTRVVIDPNDGRTVREPSGLEWCDIYFKTNRWPSLPYPSKVLPLMNANGLLSQRSLDELKAMRGFRPTRDVVYWTKIWEPGPATRYSTSDRQKIVEHQIRLFEVLASLECRTDLIAIVPHDLQTVSYVECVRRLEARGVRCQPNWGDITTRRFWAGLASARIVVLRPGNHQCISWRMTDLLAMGACIVYDGGPHPNWHVPLEAGVQYLDGQCQLTDELVLPSDVQYGDFGMRITELLRDPQSISLFKQNASTYFDSHCSFGAVGRHMLEHVSSLAKSSDTSRLDINGDAYTM